MTDRMSSAAPTVTTRAFIVKRPETAEAITAISAESQAGLRQFSLERMMGYGIDYADAIELRARILDGQAWHPAATDLPEVAARYAAEASGSAGSPTRASYLRRSAALLRMSQMMMLA